MRPIIIEGTDGVGKTTLAKRLVSSSLERVYKHSGPPKQSTWVAEYVRPLLRSDGWLTQQLVMDRWHVGEMVWPRLFGRESLFWSSREFDACNELLSLLPHPPIVYIVDRQPEMIRDELVLRGEPDVAIEKSLAARHAFLELAPLIQRRLTCHVVDSDAVYSGGLDVLRT